MRAWSSMENITLNIIHKDLEQLKEAVFEMRARMVDADSVLNQQDFVAIEEYNREKEDGVLFSHEEIKIELGL